METKLVIQEHGVGRKKASIVIEFSESETEQLDNKVCQRHADTEKPIPCHCYINVDPKNKICKGIPTWNGIPYRAYFLITSRKVLLNRSIPIKTHLRIPYPGNLDIGYINTKDEEILIDWWKAVKPKLIENIRENVFSIKQHTEYKATEIREIAESVQLNTLEDSSGKGVRKRSLEIY